MLTYDRGWETHWELSQKSPVVGITDRAGTDGLEIMYMGLSSGISGIICGGANEGSGEDSFTNIGVGAE